MQMFHQEVTEAHEVFFLSPYFPHKSSPEPNQGDRVGICVTQLDPKQLERGLLCSPKTVEQMQGALAPVTKIKYYKNDIKSRSSYHSMFFALHDWLSGWLLST